MQDSHHKLYQWPFKTRSAQLFYLTCTCKKQKAIPLQAWTGPEGSTRLRHPDFKTAGTRMW